MRKNFYFIMSLIFWLFMMVGFSDNWLTDIGQKSNFIAKFLIHAFFAFSWFTLLVFQTGLISKGNIRKHISLGIFGMVAFVGMFFTIGYIYLDRFLEIGHMVPLSKMVFSQYLFASVLIVIGFVKRKTNPVIHKSHIIIGSLFLIQPSVDRTIGKFFDEYFLFTFLLTYLILFILFIWYYKKVNWQLAVGFLIWSAGLINLLNSGDF